MARTLSSLEINLSVVTSLLLACCIGLIVVSWLSLKPEGAAEPVGLYGRMVITEGAVFSEELNDPSSLYFKSLAFDIQKLVSEAYGHSELKHLFKSCQVLYFSRGSVVVNFDLWFDQPVDVKEAEQQLGAGLQEAGPTGLVIDRNSIQITEKQDETTPAPTTTTPTTNEQKITCNFEQGMCLWRPQHNNDGDWIRINGSTFPPMTGPSFDHTLGNSSGFYIVTPPSPGHWVKIYKIQSLPLTPSTEPMCLSFWYHMFGEEVHRLSVLLQHLNIGTVVFQRDGNFGDNWNYGQVTLNLNREYTVAFEAMKKSGLINDIALDDIKLTSGACGPAPPEPTNVPLPTTPPPIPGKTQTTPPITCNTPTTSPTTADCGGPFDLWEPNSTFSSPNYPESYGSKAKCLWTLHTTSGQNIQLHFLDLDVEEIFDVVEVRDGAGPSSTILAVLTGSDRPTHDLFSTTNQMSVWFFTNSYNEGRGFTANFTSGVNLGLPAPCAAGQFQCRTGTCIPENSQCNGKIDCPDASDEADCVMLQENNTSRVQVQIGHSYFTVCADTWDSHLSVFTCQYLGYRNGEATQMPSLPQDSPFLSLIVSNGTLETNVSETCENVISLNCDNQPCGVRLNVTNNTREMHQSAESIPGQDVVRVVGGVDAAKGAWPWMVSLQWRGRHECGASLIGRDWVLTAAHCAYGRNNQLLWTAVIGLHSHSGTNSVDVQSRQVDRIIINRHYSKLTKEADIAMMHLQQPVNFTEFIQPVCLPPQGQNFTPGRKCFIAGWGRDTDGYLPDVLQQAEVPLVDQDQCQLWLPEYNITSSMLCAGYPEGGVDTCQGDSGGPLMCLDDGHWTVIGVTSFGIGCGDPQRPGVYARVSAFMSWIAEIRHSSSSPSP